MRGVRPPEAPADYVERDCSNPMCDRTTWIPPGTELAAQETDTPLLAVCSAKCAATLVEGLPGPTTFVDGTESLLPHVIDEVYVFIAVDEQGEGIPAMTLPGLGTVPLIGADKDRIDSLRPYADRMARMSGKKIKLVKFTTRVELEELG